jgi:hypothetical protein
MHGKAKPALVCVAVVLAWGVYAQAEFFKETFDSYASGSQMHGQGGWKGWDNNPSAGALVTNMRSFSSPNSVTITGSSDLVHEWTGLTSGRWEVSAMQFIPYGPTGTTYFILLNQYKDVTGPDNWSVQIPFDLGMGRVSDDFAPGPTLSLVKNQWVQLVADVNLDTDTVDFYYNGTFLSTHPWRNNDPNASREIKAIDLFANGQPVVYYDDVVIRQIPEPSLWCLLGTGLVTLGLASRRWRR